MQPENLIASEVGRKHPKVNLGRTTKQTIHAVPMFTSTKKSTLPVCSYTRETRNPDRVDSFLAIWQDINFALTENCYENIRADWRDLLKGDLYEENT